MLAYFCLLKGGEKIVDTSTSKQTGIVSSIALIQACKHCWSFSALLSSTNALQPCQTTNQQFLFMAKFRSQTGQPVFAERSDILEPVRHDEI